MLRGITRWVKGNQSTKVWLKIVIPVLTEFEIVGYNVCEIQPKAAGSLSAADRPIYVVDMCDSVRAHHQTKRELKREA